MYRIFNAVSFFTVTKIKFENIYSLFLLIEFSFKINEFAFSFFIQIINRKHYGCIHIQIGWWAAGQNCGCGWNSIEYFHHTRQIWQTAKHQSVSDHSSPFMQNGIFLTTQIESISIFHLQDVGFVCIHFIYCSNDNIIRMACVLLCSTIPLLANQRQKIRKFNDQRAYDQSKCV